MEATPARAKICLGLIFLFISLTGRGFSQTGNVTVVPVPKWVQPREWTLPANQLLSAQVEASRYLLFEHQENPADKETFTRLVVLMETQSGVQDSGKLTIGFDPNYQQLLLHRVQIHRQGQVLDRLDRSKIKVIQPEPELDADVFTGRASAVLFIEDLRVGDALEYSYTVRGENPILRGHFSTRFTVQSTVPVNKQRMRIIWSGTNQLGMRQYLTPLKAQQKTENGTTEYVWDWDNLEAIPYEDDLPVSYEPYPYIELSDFDSWSSVVNWALPLYSLKDTNLPPDLGVLISNWEKSGHSPEERARLAVDFVQDELRYTGLEMGPDSYRPTDPAETFRLRYGDCKGKALLLCSILRRMGLEANVALVSTSSRETVANRLPTPFAFNHAIVKLLLDEKIVFLDATRSQQGGSLWGRSLAPYAKALVIQPGCGGLEAIPLTDSGNRQQVTSVFYIKDYKSPSRMTVTTAYYGAEADRMRSYLAGADRKEVGESYLNFYAAYYPKIHEVRPFEVKDQRTRNMLEVSEEYEIQEIWKQDKAGQQWHASFYPDNLIKALTAPETRLRKMPLGLPYPFKREQDILVHLPDTGWAISSASENIEGEGFSFHFQREFSGSVMRLHYDCATKTTVMPAGRVAEHLKKLEEMDDLLGDTLYQPEAALTEGLARINWLMVVLAAFGLTGATLAVGWFWRMVCRPARTAIEGVPPPLLLEAHLNGLGGWLVLVGIGLCLVLVSRPIQLAWNWEGYFSSAAWQAAATPGGASYHPLFGPLLMFELLGISLFWLSPL